MWPIFRFLFILKDSTTHDSCVVCPLWNKAKSKDVEFGEVDGHCPHPHFKLDTLASRHAVNKTLTYYNLKKFFYGECVNKQLSICTSNSCVTVNLRKSDIHSSFSLVLVSTNTYELILAF